MGFHHTQEVGSSLGNTRIVENIVIEMLITRLSVIDDATCIVNDYNGISLLR